MAAPTRKKPAKTNRPQTFDRQRKKVLRREVPVITNDEVLEELGAAREAHEANPTEATKKRVEKAEAAVEEATDIYVCVGIGRKKFEAIADNNPPTEEEIAEAKENGEPPPPYAAEPYTVEVFHRCIESPEVSLDDAQWIYDNWTNAEIINLFTACLAVNTQRRVVQLGE